jgi:hypothetical protein
MIYILFMYSSVCNDAVKQRRKKERNRQERFCVFVEGKKSTQVGLGMEHKKWVAHLHHEVQHQITRQMK